MIRERAKKYGLDAPASYWTVDEATLDMMTGGCGPGQFGNHGWFDRAWGVNIKAACSIHDYEYAIGKTIKEKNRADERFLINMLKVIRIESSWKFLRVVRNQRALTYYDLVSMNGLDAFRNATVS